MIRGVPLYIQGVRGLTPATGVLKLRVGEQETDHEKMLQAWHTINYF